MYRGRDPMGSGMAIIDDLSYSVTLSFSSFCQLLGTNYSLYRISLPTYNLAVDVLLCTSFIYCCIRGLFPELVQGGLVARTPSFDSIPLKTVSLVFSSMSILNEELAHVAK